MYKKLVGKGTFLVTTVAILIATGLAIDSCQAAPLSHQARSDATPNLNLWIDAIYYINVVNMSTIRINITYGVHEISIGNINFTAKALRDNWSTMGKSFEENITKELDRTANELYNTTYPNDTVEFEDTKCNYSSIYIPSLDDFNPPLYFTKNVIVIFNATTYGFENPKLNLEDVLRSTLKMGAQIDKNFTLGAPPGYNNTYILRMPGYIKILSDDEDTSDETATWSIEYLNATNLSAEAYEVVRTFTIGSREAVDLPKEEIATNVTIDLENFENLTLYGSIEIRSVNLNKYNISLPSNIKNLSFVSADWLRMAFDNGLANASDLENETKKKLKEVENKFYSSFNTTLNLTFKWNASSLTGYDIENMSCEPPLKCSFNSTRISLSYENFDYEVLEGFLNAGGKFKIVIPRSEEDYNLRLLLPENINLSILKGLTKWDKVGTRNSYSWHSSQECEFNLYSGLAPNYTESKTDVFIIFDFYKIDIFKLAGRINMTFSIFLYYYKRPPEFSLPENVSIDYVNADLIRLLVAKDIISIANLTEEFERLFSNLTSMFGENISMTVYVVQQSLEGYNLSSMSGEREVKIRGYAECELKLKQEENTTGGMELALFEGLITKQFNFTIQGFEECNTTFILRLPHGIKILELHDTLGRAVRGSEEGRDHCLVWLKGNETSVVYITIDLTPFIINFILPFIMIGIILGVAGAVIKIISWREEKFIGKIL
ncbi:MAG: hypothetical protein AB1485_01205 [Candidatus Thermoplasmatota archaeon]